MEYNPVPEELISFEVYCSEIENIPYYNFLSEREFEVVYERHEQYLESKGLQCLN